MKIILSSAILLSFIVTSLGLAAIPVKSIKTNTSVKMQMGNTFKLKVAFTPANATNRKVAFSSADESIATVSSTGYIKAIKAGKTVVTVTSVSNNKAVAKCNVTIIPFFPLKKQITLTVFTGNSTTQWTYDYKKLPESPIYKRYRELTNIKFKFENVEPDAFQLAVQTKLATGDLPDLTYLGLPEPQVNQIIESGKILKLNDYYHKYVPGIWKNITSIPEFKATALGVDGSIYVTANTRDYWDIFNANFSWNVDAVKKAGYDPNAKMTYEDFYQLLKKMKTNGITSPWLPSYRGNANIFGLDFTNQGFYADNGLVKSNFANPHFKEYLAWLNKLYNEGLIPKEFDLTLNNTDQFYNLITQNKLGAISKSVGWAYGFNPALVTAGVMKEDSDAMWLPAPPIQGPYGDRFYYTYPKVSKANWVISSASRYKAEAFNWLMYVSNDPKMNILQMWGIEGLTYKIKSDGNKEMIMKISDYMNAGIQFPWPQFVQIDDWAAGLPISPKSQAQFTKQCKDLWVKEYYKLGFPNISLTNAETDERDKYLNDFNTYCNENSLKFIKGERSLNEFDEFVKGLNNAGLDKLLKVYQSMYDRYLRLTK